MMAVTGKRVYPNEAGYLSGMKSGEYGKEPDGMWYCCPPVNEHCPGMLNDHKVEEHEDGTITVSPSIDMQGIWHGFLKRGVWTEC